MRVAPAVSQNTRYPLVLGSKPTFAVQVYQPDNGTVMACGVPLDHIDDRPWVSAVSKAIVVGTPFGMDCTLPRVARIRACCEARSNQPDPAFRSGVRRSRTRRSSLRLRP